MYIPTLGRFMSRDPLHQDYDVLSDNNWFGQNLDAMAQRGYAYVSNNPVNFVDPSGLNSDDAGNLYQDVGGNPEWNADPSVPNDSIAPAHLCAMRPSIVPPKKNTCELAYSRQVNPGAICDRKRGEKAFS